jgi:hypothetical protein
VRVLSTGRGRRDAAAEDRQRRSRLRELESACGAGSRRARATRKHWSYEPPRPTEPPAVKLTSWPRGPIDRFLLARLENAGLTPQPEADRANAHPPRQPRSDRPASDRRGGRRLRHRSPPRRLRATSSTVCLARPTYGEHWARGWLDLARYADSKGYADDQLRSMWRYRDYVIDAFNRNTPFDQFTIEQLAGDLLPKPTLDQLFATGFHRNTMNNTEGGTDDEEFRTVAVIDRVNTTFSVWMGSSMACAQCHTHKYDPFTHKEYFQLYAIFNQSEDADRDSEAPVIDFYTDEQKAQRAAAQAELDRDCTPPCSRPARAAPMPPAPGPPPFPARWNGPARNPSTCAPRPAPHSPRRPMAPYWSPRARTPTRSPSTFRSRPVGLSRRFVSKPCRTRRCPDGGPGGAKGAFVLTRFRAAIKPAVPYRQGRYIRVELPGKDRVLALAEVQVWSEGRNVAPGGVASQPSTAGGAAAARAIDGNTEGDLARGSVSLTETAETAWWEVDLQATVPVERVVVYGRTGAESTPGHLKVTVLDANRQPVWELLHRDAPAAESRVPARRTDRDQTRARAHQPRGRRP